MKQLVTLPFVMLLSACLSHPPPAPAPYRASGGPPPWTLLIDERDVTFIQGQTVIRQPTPQVIHGFAGEIYQTPRIGVNAVHVGCTDPGTGRTYRDRVEVDVDGKRFVGCGGDETAAAPATLPGLAGNRWRVSAVNGRPTPDAGDYVVRFEGDGLGAKFGCNNMGGTYRIENGALVVTELNQTLIGCPEPAATFEREGAAVLSKPMTIGRNPRTGDTILTSAGGRLDLTLIVTGTRL